MIEDEPGSSLSLRDMDLTDDAYYMFDQDNNYGKRLQTLICCKILVCSSAMRFVHNHEHVRGGISISAMPTAYLLPSHLLQLTCAVCASARPF